MFNALKLEKELSRQGIPLFATDEPADIEGVNATTVLVRRVKQGVAEWYRLQLKEKIWKGLVEHSLDGWNIGTPPYGFLADRIPHPVPFKAAQGRTKSRLDPRPGPRPGHRADVHLADGGQAGLPGHRRPAQRRPGRLPAAEPRHRVDRAERPGHPGQPQIHRAHGLRPTPHPQRPPHPRPGRSVAVVTRARPPRHRRPGHLGRRPGRRRRARHQPRRRRPEHPPGHPPVLPLPVPHPLPGLPPPHDRHHLRQLPAGNLTYYRCPHDPATPKHAADHPDHPRTVQAPETRLDQIVGQFFASRIFGPGRAALLAAQLPATDADATARASRGRPAPGPDQADRDRAELPDPRARAPPRRPGRHRSRRHARPHPRPLRRPPPRTRTARNPARRPGQDHPQPLPTPPCSTNSRSWATSCPACRPPSRPACSPRSASKSCGTSPASRSPCSPRSPTTPCRPSPASPTPARTATTTPAPSTHATQPRPHVGSEQHP